jgi:hypothetical protein
MFDWVSLDQNLVADLLRQKVSVVNYMTSCNLAMA